MLKFATTRIRDVPSSVAFATIRSERFTQFRSDPSAQLAIGFKLREREFTLPAFDHLYVILTPVLPPGDTEPSTLKLDSRIRYVDVGLSPDQWAALDDDSKHVHLVDLTSSAISTFDGDSETLMNVAADVKRYRSQLEITVKTKETASYRVDLSYQNRPLQEQSLLFVSYVDKTTGQCGRIAIAKLLSANDVYCLCGSIAVRNDTITIKPRSSSRAAIIMKKYNVPLTASVATVLAASGTEQCAEPKSR